MQKNLSNSSKFLSSPISFLLIFLWIANDHFWKAQFHNEITGKISDITGLIVFPFFLTAIGFMASYGSVREKNLFLFSNLSIAILFFIINWSQDWNNWIYINCFGNQNGTADKTDLLCIPICLLVNFYFYKKYSAKEISISTKIRYLHIIAITLSALAFINTSTADKKTQREEDILYPILIAKPDYRDTYKIGEEVFFIWYTEGVFKEFQIILYPMYSESPEKVISIKPSQLKKQFDERISKYYYIYSEELNLAEDYYRLAVIGSKNNNWKEKSPSEIFNLIKTNTCREINLSCSDFRWIGFQE